MKPCQYLYLETQMTIGMVKVTMVLLWCACSYAAKAWDLLQNME